MRILIPVDAGCPGSISMSALDQGKEDVWVPTQQVEPDIYVALAGALS
ncbi:MAG TPA: hypothetical protein VKU37_10595 [Verrucomicrobiae bacterium]|nr:hypothetical protein [Verrucomicrobiae bacterium]